MSYLMLYCSTYDVVTAARPQASLNAAQGVPAPWDEADLILG
jgi:hypothetical protein